MEGKGSKWERSGRGGGGVNGREGKWTRGRGSLLFNGCFGRVC